MTIPPYRVEPVSSDLIDDSMHPDIAASFAIHDTAAARSEVGLAEMPTIVATGPFDDLSDGEQLADAFTLVRQRYSAQLVLLGTGRQRTAVVRRTFSRGVGSDVHLIRAMSTGLWSEIVAAADIVVPGTTSQPAHLLDVLAAGRPVVAPVNPATVKLVLPTSAGLVYRPGDVDALAAALLRLLASPTLRYGMGCRAAEVGRRDPLIMRLQHPEMAGGYARRHPAAVNVGRPDVV
ncbi:glycosyltransferase [Mycolicibacterium stellerae]|uniref:glycosyltransferase n=1 Tax=Mycolicibacterium stellerae TaxID=2358193 RepID=UPI001F355B42|nr:glycosyltransferase [Mycolicibacterium stellerae]